MLFSYPILHTADMKLHLPVKLFRSVAAAFACCASMASAAIVVQDAKPFDDGSMNLFTFEDTDLVMKGNWKMSKYERDYRDVGLDWIGEAGATYTLSGSGTVYGSDYWYAWWAISSSGNADNPSTFVIGSKIKMRDVCMDVMNGAHVVIQGNMYNNCSVNVQSGAVADLTNANTSGKFNQFNFEGGTIIDDSLTFTSTHWMEIHAPSVMQGNLVLAGKNTTPTKLKKFSNDDYDMQDTDGSVTIYDGGTLTITGDLSVTRKTTVYFTSLYEASNSELLVPECDEAVFTVQGSVSEASAQNLIPALWWWYGDYDYYAPLKERCFVATAGADGYTYIYLGYTPDEDGAPGNATRVELGESLTLTEAPSLRKPVFIAGGTLDVRALDSSALINQYILGNGGTLVADSSQTVSLSGNADIRYGVTGANLLFGTPGVFSHLFLCGQYSGASYTVQGGTVSLRSGATLGSSDSSAPLRIEDGASFTNYGMLLADTTVAGGASLLNEGHIQAGVQVDSGALYVNHGLHEGNLSVAGAVHGSGAFGATTVNSGGALHVDNESGVQQHESLSLQSGSSVSFYTPSSELPPYLDSHSVLSVDSLTLESGCKFDVSTISGRGSYELVRYGSLSGSVADVTLLTPDAPMNEYTLVHNAQDKTLSLDITGMAVWSWNTKAKKGIWQNGVVENSPLLGRALDGFLPGDMLSITSGATITLVGELAPSVLSINSAKTVTLSVNKKTPGCLVGEGCVRICGTGKVTLNDGNSYSGGTFIESGSVNAKGATSFGSGAITISGGVLNLASKAVANDIVVQGDVLIKGGKKFAGNVTLMGYGLKKGSVINIAAGKTVEYVSVENDDYEDDYDESPFSSAAAINGSISGDGAFLIDLSGWDEDGEWYESYNYAYLGEKGKITCDLTLRGNLHVSRKGLMMNKKTSDIIVDSGDLYSEGKISAYSITLMNGGHLNVAKAKPLSVSFTGKFKAESAPPIEESEDLYWMEYAADVSKAHIYGKLSVGEMELVNSGVFVEQTYAYENNPKAQNVTVKQAAVLDASYLRIGGNLSAGSLVLSNGSRLELYNPTGSNKNMSLKVKQDMYLGGGSLVRLKGALSAKNLTLGSGSIALTSSKLQTIKVGNMLSFEDGADFSLHLGFSVSEKDFKKHKAFKIISFKSMGGCLTLDSDLNDMLNISSDMATLSFDSKHKSITLVVLDLDAWNDYAESVREMEYDTGAYALADFSLRSSDAVAPEDLLTAPKPVAAAAVDPLLRKAADTLVQSTWGTVNASRAFGDTIAARGAHATLLAEGRGAAWLSTMGGSSRISSDGERNGADFTLSGAAFGVEGRVTEKSTLGVAIGNSWGKVSTFSAFPVDQDSMHIGIYGNHTLTESLTLSWMATHTRTESELNLLGLPYEWAQDALQLDARLTWATAISDKTTLRVFGGLQYLATDSGESNGLKTGSVQNLRGELGIGASHKCSDSTLVFGELSFVGDMVRNNPTADLGGMRLRGSNPGRAGINLSVGAAHRLSDDWSLNASYSFELMQNVTSHSLNVGASYSF